MAIVNSTGSNSKYFLHLSPSLGAKKQKVPDELLIKIQKNIPRSGDEIGPGVSWA